MPQGGQQLPPNNRRLSVRTPAPNLPPAAAPTSEAIGAEHVEEAQQDAGHVRPQHEDIVCDIAVGHPATTIGDECGKRQGVEVAQHALAARPQHRPHGRQEEEEAWRSEEAERWAVGKSGGGWYKRPTLCCAAAVLLTCSQSHAAELPAAVPPTYNAAQGGHSTLPSGRHTVLRLQRSGRPRPTGGPCRLLRCLLAGVLAAKSFASDRGLRSRPRRLCRPVRIRACQDDWQVAIVSPGNDLADSAHSRHRHLALLKAAGANFQLP